MAALEIGISLTGTVSAGAYTAGVVDFLLEALEEWDKQMQADQSQFGNDRSKWTVPWHQVIVKGLSGASGGGVTTGLILNCLGKNVPHVVKPPDPTVGGTGNDFFDAWVLQLGIEQLLDTEDLSQNKVQSLLNANAIPNIADKILQRSNFGSTNKRPYIDPHLFAVITVANLAGIPVAITYQDPLSHTVVYYKHTDHMMIELSQDGTQAHNESYVLPFDLNNPNFDAGYAQLRALCLATCAFPAAFKAQPLTQLISIYKMRNDGNIWDQFPGKTYSFLCADGGIFNTEPFQLLDDQMGPRQPEAKNLSRAIISVAPLELFDPANVKPNADDSLLTVLPEVATGLREDALTNDEQIAKAFDETDYSRYIIAPTRTSTPTANDRLSPAITGTTLGTFGAFLSKDFRVHDFFLGRRNAQQFLRNHFTIPVSSMSQNPIFQDEAPFIGSTLQQFLSADSNGQRNYFPIIPLCGTAAADQYFPTWPTAKGYSISSIQDLLTQRVDKLLSLTQDALKLGWLSNLLVTVVKNQVSNALVQGAMTQIQNALTKANL